MKLYSVTSLNLAQIYVFARRSDDAADLYTTFKALLGQAHEGFAVLRVVRRMGFKQDKFLHRILKTGVRGVGVPHPKNMPGLTDERKWIIWTEHVPDAEA